MSVHKSLINGKFVPISQISRAKRPKIGGYGKLKGVKPKQAEFKENAASTAAWRKTVARDPKEGRATLQYAGLAGATLRSGSKSSGKSTVIINHHGIAANSSSRRNYRKNLKMVQTHENAHAGPKRSSYRLAQVTQSPRRTGREEGRADFLAMGHHSGYKSKMERSYSDSGGKFGQGYREVQDKMRAAGTKVRKEFPIKKDSPASPDLGFRGGSLVPTKARRKKRAAS